ncbi:MAG TPA: ABC transporter permease [Vicinamibacterales bacterium]|nr:ABC transporter permease [Vicinamibacterales bacterium]
MIRDAIRDVRHAIRLLMASPAFTLVAVVTLALGIGANTAIFSVVNALLLRPLPYHEPERLLFVEASLSRPEGQTRFQVSYQDIEAIRSQSTTIGAITAWNTAWGLALDGSDGARRLEANFVGRDYFSILGAAPAMGRVFSADEHLAGGSGPLVVVLSDATWRQEFGADPGIVGKNVRLQNQVFTVVGVMPASFSDVAISTGSRVDVWSPVERAPELFGGINLRDRGNRLLWAVARLTPGATTDAARAELQTLASQIAAAYPASHTNFSFLADPLASRYFIEARRPLWFLLGGSLFVLLIGCANVANLLLVRSSVRSREFAVRQAMGASTGRLVRQLLAESVVLAIAGSLAGLALAAWLTPVLVRLSGIEVPAYASIGIDGAVLVVAALTALSCGVLFGLAPVWRAAKTSVRDAIGTSRVSSGSNAARWLAGVEVTTAFVLASAALLMLQSFQALTRTDLQFRSDHLLTVRLELPVDRYGTPAARAQAGNQMREALAALPGVEHVTIWGPSMFARSTWVAMLSAADRVTADNERLMVWRHNTNPGALADLRIRLIRGRDFAPTDTLDTAPVAILSETAAARLWPGQDAVGRQLRMGAATTPLITVIGVAADARHRGRFRFSQGASAFEPQLDVYRPYSQLPSALVTFGVRTTNDPDLSTGAVRSAIATIDPLVPIYDIASLDRRLRNEESPLAFAALLLNLYGGLAILLAAIGVYGVLAAAVAGRTREIGIRAALGADPRRLVASVMSEGLTVSVIAVIVGAVVAWALARSFSSVLFGVADSTAITLAGAAAMLIAMAVAASAVPARRASRVDPVSALRND